MPCHFEDYFIPPCDLCLEDTKESSIDTENVENSDSVSKKVCCYVRLFCVFVVLLNNKFILECSNLLKVSDGRHTASQSQHRADGSGCSVPFGIRKWKRELLFFSHFQLIRLR